MTAPINKAPTFRKLLKGAMGGEVVVPALRTALFDPRFKSIPIRVPEFRPRPPDGYFHPSTHPLMPERMLYYYLAEPSKLVPEPFDPHATMAVTQGTFWHDFIQHIGLQVGILKPPPGKCPCGCDTKVEWYVVDEELGDRGHMDGVVNGAQAGLDGDESWEFKTMRPSRFQRIEKGHPTDPPVLESFIKIAPEYHAQGQDYMRISGFRRHRFTILSMEYPFEMREIVMPYDAAFAHEIAAKYRRVRQAVADRTQLAACCAPRSADARACFARTICPVGAIG